jgi:hypothetical protein
MPTSIGQGNKKRMLLALETSEAVVATVVRPEYKSEVGNEHHNGRVTSIRSK